MAVPNLEVPGVLLDLDAFAVVVPDCVVRDLVPTIRVLPNAEDHDTNATYRAPDLAGVECRARGLVELDVAVHDVLQSKNTFYHRT